MSIVFWSDSAQEAQALVAKVNGAVPKDDRESTLSNIQFMPDGRPDLAPPEAEVVAPPPEPEPVPEEEPA